MREIKYRAWDKASRKILEVIEIDLTSMEILVLDHDELEAREAVYGHYGLMQYTGLNDNNGAEIYEGDILSWKIFDGMAHFNGTHKVYFDNGAFRLNRYHSVIDYINNGDVEIIGNIHEHPHLLKEDN